MVAVNETRSGSVSRVVVAGRTGGDAVCRWSYRFFIFAHWSYLS